MSFENKFGAGREQRAAGGNPAANEAAANEAQEPELEQALKNFRLSVRAWSDAALSGPRRSVAAAPHRAWRLAAGWALGSALVIGGVSGGVYERNHQIQLAKIRAAQEAGHQRQLAEQRAKEAEDLLAKVDSDISRDVPSAMEPLAQLMAEDESK